MSKVDKKMNSQSFECRNCFEKGNGRCSIIVSYHDDLPYRVLKGAHLCPFNIYSDGCMTETSDTIVSDCIDEDDIESLETILKFLKHGSPIGIEEKEKLDDIIKILKKHVTLERLYNGE